MRLLIITQTIDINDPVLGFFYFWVREFAKHCEMVTVICLQEGNHDFLPSVKVLSLGKEKGASKLKYLFNFYKYIWQERGNYDTIFIHMNQMYVLLGWGIWRILKKKISLWYAHGHVPFSLRVAEKFLDYIFTSTKSGCRLKSNKIRVVGQGIDTDKFLPSVDSKQTKEGGVFKIITVGRISPVKDYETLINAVDLLNKKGVKFKIDIIGGAGLLEQEKYLEDLKIMVVGSGLDSMVNFIGAVPNNDIIDYLQSSDLFVNMSHTGSLDKTILEAMSVGLPVLSCNEALLEVLGDYKNKLMYHKNDFKEFADKIQFVMGLSEEDRREMGNDLRNLVIDKHSIGNLMKKILKIMKD